MIMIVEVSLSRLRQYDEALCVIMKTLSLYILSLFSTFQVWAQADTTESKDTINWRADYKLQWKDFQGTPDSSVIALAVCASEIIYQYRIVDGKLTFKIDCYFDKKRSWIKHNMKAILDHEQGHFDISKLFALKLEEKFLAYKLKVASVNIDLAKVYNQIVQERTAMHDRYDSETKSTVSDKLQMAFLKKIRQEITSISRRLKKNERTTAVAVAQLGL